MSIGSELLPEFDQEMGTTRRLLERVPAERVRWKPHAKSFALGHLAQLLARMPGWITAAITADSLDLAMGPGYTFETPETLLHEFDDNVKGARAALAAAPDAAFDAPWSLKVGERTVFTLPRKDIVRQDISHLVHHRGQLSVYLRLLDVPLPQIYGPTADDRAF